MRTKLSRSSVPCLQVVLQGFLEIYQRIQSRFGSTNRVVVGLACTGVFFHILYVFAEIKPFVYVKYL